MLFAHVPPAPRKGSEFCVKIDLFVHYGAIRTNRRKHALADNVIEDGLLSVQG